MLESSQWPRVGIFAGITYHLGNYDECLMVTSHTFQGQYCLAEGTYDFNNVESNHDLLQPVEWPTENLSAWEAIKMVSYFLYHCFIKIKVTLKKIFANTYMTIQKLSVVRTQNTS